MAEKKKSAMNVPLRPLDNLFEPTIKEEPKTTGTNSLSVDNLHAFKGHPFKMYTEERMAEMVDSVKEHGVIAPILVRPNKYGDGYEIISGHNRVEACRRAGIKEIPATIRDLDDDTAIILMNADGTVVKTSMIEDGYRVPDENGSETFKVDAKGNAEFRYLPEGEYKFVENTPVGYISEGEYAFKLTDADSYSKPYIMTVENDPTGLKILKIDAKTGNPLTGAGFRIKMKDGLGFEMLTFIQMEDGSYFFDENGTIMDMMVDVNGEIILYGLPLGDVWIEESIVPDGYFPISAQKAEITKETSFENPLVMEIENSVFVKLGMDSDWWEFPALMLGIALALGGAVTLIVVKRKKKNQEV